MNHIALDPRFHDLINVSAPLQTIATGCTFTEGPIWHPLEHHLLFSDMPGDVRRRWSEKDGVTEVMRPANKCNGMTYDANLDLLVCEHSTSKLMRERRDGTRETVASHFEGKELNSPNDVIVASDGSIYFSDPWYGRMPVFGEERARQIDWQGVFRIAAGSGEPELVVDFAQFTMPNGLCFSPDESRLYVNDTVEATIWQFEVAPSGPLTNPRLFAQGLQDNDLPGVPDGMKCDEFGNIWCTAPGGVWIFSAAGELIGKLVVPEVVANLHWGGRDFRTLFLAATTSVFSVTTKVGPRSEPFMVA